MTPKLEMLNTLKAELPHVWGDEPFDAIPFYTAVEYMKANKPTVLYISLGETDDWAHGGQYTEYLDSAHRVDAYLKAIWDLAQSMPEYQGNTTLIFSPDHGRGKAPHKWQSHGGKIPDSKYIWMAFLGPDTQPLGERIEDSAGDAEPNRRNAGGVSRRRLRRRRSEGRQADRRRSASLSRFANGVGSKRFLAQFAADGCPSCSNRV